jgi:acyl carrier protein
MIDPTLQTELSDSVRSIARISADIPIRADSRLVEDLGIDSLDLVSIVLSAQENYGVPIDEDEVANFRTMADLVLYVDRRRGAAAA